MTVKRIQKKDFWKKHIEAWETSGLTQQKYCERENITLSSFGAWRTRLLKVNVKKEKSPTVAFLPAMIKEKHLAVTKTATEMIFVFPNQCQLVLPTHLPTDKLINLVKNFGGLL